jgi:hypothetical protein
MDTQLGRFLIFTTCSENGVKTRPQELIGAPIKTGGVCCSNCFRSWSWPDSQIYYSLFSVSDRSEIEKINQHMHMTGGGNLAATTHSNGRIE